MARPLCARDGCENELKTGKKYCSTQCANLARSEKVAERKEATASVETSIKMMRSGAIPDALENFLIKKLGHSGCAAMLAEMERQWQSGDFVRASSQQDGIYGADYGRYPYWLPTGEAPNMPRKSKNPPESSPIEPHTPLMKRAGGYLTDTRRDSKIPFLDIDRMMSLGPCLLASRLKQGPILRTLASPRKWRVRSPDNKLAQIARADLQRFFLMHGRDMLTSIPYGAAFGSVMWHKVRADEIGEFEGIGKSSTWWTIDKADWAHPSTINEILRYEKTRQFAGFTHKRALETSDVVIAPPSALLITHDKRFGDLWGTSIFNAGYDFAVWYERVMIAFLRFLDEDANKKIMVKGPSNGSTTYLGQKIRNVDYALMLGESVRRTGVFTVPSECDINTNNPLWEVSYLKSDAVGTQFIEALRYLATEILRASVIGDSSVTQNSEFGSRANSTIHQQVTQIDNHLAFVDLISHINEHVAPRYGMFNRNYNNPPAVVVEAEVLDFVEQDILMRLVATMGNFKLGEGTPGDMVDWETVLNSMQIPVLSEAKRKEMLEKVAEEAKKKAEAFGLKPEQPPQNQQNQPSSSGREPEMDDGDRQAESVANSVKNTGSVPAVMLTSRTLASAVASELIGPGDIA